MDSVLIVEDDDFTRMLLEQACVSLGYECVAVGSGVEARREWQARSFDIGLLDLDLGPGPTGIDLARSLRSEQPDLRLIILTSYSDPRLYGNLPPTPPDVAVVTKQTVRDVNGLHDVLRGTTPEPLDGDSQLSDAQVEMLRLIATGCTNAEIGRRLWLSEPGVDKALGRLAQRLGINATSTSNRRVLLAQEFYRRTGWEHGGAT